MDVVWLSVLSSALLQSWQCFSLLTDSVRNLVRAEKRWLLSVSQCSGPQVGLEGVTGSLHIHVRCLGWVAGLLTAAPCLPHRTEQCVPGGTCGGRRVSSSR